MVEAKIDTVVMEVSSQSLKLHRVDDCQFDIGLFTNFSEDHISPKEHPDMEDYFNSKLKLFDMCKIGFINADDFNVLKVKKLAKNCDIKTYGIDNAADLLAKDITITNSSVDFKVNDTVGQGAIIGTSGENNISRDLGNHLHFELYYKGNVVNPDDYYGKLTSELN